MFIKGQTVHFKKTAVLGNTEIQAGTDGLITKVHSYTRWPSDYIVLVTLLGHEMEVFIPSDIAADCMEVK